MCLFGQFTILTHHHHCRRHTVECEESPRLLLFSDKTLSIFHNFYHNFSSSSPLHYDVICLDENEKNLPFFLTLTFAGWLHFLRFIRSVVREMFIHIKYLCLSNKRAAKKMEKRDLYEIFSHSRMVAGARWFIFGS